MRPETIEILKKIEQQLFESEEHASVRAALSQSPQNSDVPEDVDDILDRIKEYAPAMQQFVESFITSPTIR